MRVSDVIQGQAIVDGDGKPNRVGVALLKTIAEVLRRTGGPTGKALGPLESYTVATLPDAATYARCWIWVSDETGGATAAISDGTNWLRMQDRATVS